MTIYSVLERSHGPDRDGAISPPPERGEETVGREEWQKTILGMVLTPT